MIWRPRPGQRVRLHYRKAIVAFMPCHGRTGTVRIAGSGPGPINVLVDLDGGGATCAPRGNLVAKED